MTGGLRTYRAKRDCPEQCDCMWCANDRLKAHIAELEAEVKRLTAEVERLRARVVELEAISGIAAHELAMSMRGVRTPCDSCAGYGVGRYPSTATWHGGIGGQAITRDVCSVCWGSGDAKKSWPSHEELEEKYERLAALRAAAEEEPDD